MSCSLSCSAVRITCFWGGCTVHRWFSLFVVTCVIFSGFCCGRTTKLSCLEGLMSFHLKQIIIRGSFKPHCCTLMFADTKCEQTCVFTRSLSHDIFLFLSKMSVNVLCPRVGHLGSLNTCFHEQSSQSGLRVTSSGLNSWMTK